MKYFSVLLFLVCFTSTYGELTEFLWSQDEVSGVYKNDNGSIGIKFVTTESYLEIDTLDNVTLVYLSAFREVNKRLARSVHIMDSEYIQHKSIAHSHLDGPVDNDTKDFKDSLKELLQLEESLLLENASRAVGNRGVTGKNTPAVLPFYMFALQVSRLIDSSSPIISGKTDDVPPRQKRISWRPKILSWVKGMLSRKSCAELGKRPPDNNGECRGLCGRLCKCWKWVCGDCCWHKGCAEHDDCCERKDVVGKIRCFIPIGFKCDRSYSCKFKEVIKTAIVIGAKYAIGRYIFG